jgi:FAD synthetase
MHGNKTAAKPLRVMATGVFDLLHPGHIYYLEQSRALGDELFVVVANDTVVRRSKGEPLFAEESRAHMVGALRCVDTVIVPTNTDPSRYYQTVLDIQPDIITLGHDQKFSEVELEKELRQHGWDGKVVRIDTYPGDHISSSHLKQRIKNQ